MNLHPQLKLFTTFNDDLANNIQGVILLGPGSLCPIVGMTLLFIGLLLPNSNEKSKTH